MRSTVMSDKKIMPAIYSNDSPFDKITIESFDKQRSPVGQLQIGKKTYYANKQCFESATIFKALEIALSSKWWDSLSPRSRSNYLFVLKAFIPWLNKFRFKPSNRLKALKKYESYRAKSMKIDSTGLRQIVNLLRKSTEKGILTPQELRFVVSIYRASQPLPSHERISYTLTRHFASMPWLKQYMGEKWFLVESPKRLINSFLISTSISLEALVEARIATRNFKFENYNPRTKKSYQGNNYWILYAKNLLKETLTTNSEELFLLQLADFVSEKKHRQISQFFENDTHFDDINSKVKRELFNRKCFLKPNLFSPYTSSGPSVIEQQLFAWLCAAQTVAPSSISKLTKRNFAIEYGPRGNLAYIQCSYHKSRSSGVKRTKILGINDIESVAITSYIAEYGKGNNFLCPDKLRIIAYNFNSFGNFLSRLVRIWQIPSIRERIIKEHKKRSIDPILLDAIETISKKMGPSFPKWSNQQKKLGNDFSYESYVKANKCYTPISLFGLSHIKTSAVHAQSDRYRSGDLLNYNSHTAETEKYSYLTDSNKDWVNQYGRITRLVMNEVERTHTEIDFNSVITSARKKTVCKVLAENSSNQISPTENYLDQKGSIVVIDSVETVINFLHYIDQAKLNFRNLLPKNQEFVEKILLPNVEWMSYMLIQKLSPAIVAEGKSEFKKIRHILPSLFQAQLTFTL